MSKHTQSVFGSCSTVVGLVFGTLAVGVVTKVSGTYSFGGLEISNAELGASFC